MAKGSGGAGRVAVGEAALIRHERAVSSAEQRKADIDRLRDLRKRVQAKSHTLFDVRAGRYRVGVEGRGGRDYIEAKRVGLYVERIKGPNATVSVFARKREDAQGLIDYIKGGGTYGSVRFSELLGYSKAEISEYHEFLRLDRKIGG